MTLSSFTSADGTATISGQVPQLGYERTVDRTLVHRESLAEVFLTDIRRIDDNTYASAAQLPRTHAYYGDHLLRPSTYDPILLLEACRQAALAGAHDCYGVPRDHKFILTHLNIHLAQPRHIVVGRAPCHLSILVTTHGRKVRDGRTIGIDYEMILITDGAEIGRAGLGLRFKSAQEYTNLRLRNRDGVAFPSSADFADSVPGNRLHPHLVGRADPDNAILTDAEPTLWGTQAVLRVPTGHASMFDHPQDHVPGMVLAEAARQLALYSVMERRGVSAVKAFPTDLTVTFRQFAELDQLTTMHATVGDRTRATEDPQAAVYYTLGGVLDLEAMAEPGSHVDQLPTQIEFRQGGTTITTASVALTHVHLG